MFDPTLCCPDGDLFCARPDLLVGLDGLHVIGVERHDNVGLGDADLTAARFGDTRLTRLNMPVLKAPDSSWVGTEIVASRIGAWEGYGASLRAAQLTECKITYANLRGASIGAISGKDGLRDARMSENQVTLLAGPFAAHLGVIVE